MPVLRGYSAGSFSAHIDGVADTSWIKSIEGGFLKGKVVQEQIGPELYNFKHLSTVEVEPVSVEMGMAISWPVLEWIRDSWLRKFGRRNATFLHADFNGNVQYEQELTNALITETTFPGLDASAKSPAYLKLKLQPENATLRKSSGRLQADYGGSDKQKRWSPAAFRLNIDGLGELRVSKIGEFTVKQNTKQLRTGRSRLAEIEPTGIEFPDLQVTMPLAYADEVVRWYNEFVVEGRRDTTQEKQGSIEFLGPSYGEVLFELTLQNIGINSFSVEKSEGHADSMKMCQFGLHVESITMGPGMGLE